MAGDAAAAAIAAAGTIAAQEGGGGAQIQSDFGGYLDDVDGGYGDPRGQSEVTIEVDTSGNGGNFAFVPTGIWIDPGTTVTWERTDKGGGHNVVASEDTLLDSGVAIFEAGSIYEYTFEGSGITKYHCMLHEALGILGAVAVGDDVVTISTGSGGERELHELDVPIQAHWAGSTTILGILVTVIHTFFISKYGEPPSTGNAGGGE